MDLCNSKIWRKILPLFTLILLILAYIFPTNKPVSNGPTIIIDDPDTPLASLVDAYFYLPHEDVSFDDILADISTLSEDMFDFVGEGTVFYEHDIFDDPSELAGMIQSEPDFSSFVSDGQTIEWNYLYYYNESIYLVAGHVVDIPEEDIYEETEETVETYEAEYYLYNPRFFSATSTSVAPAICKDLGGGLYCYTEDIHNDPDTVWSQVYSEPDYEAPDGQYIEWGSAYYYRGSLVVIGRYVTGEKPALAYQSSPDEQYDEEDFDMALSEDEESELAESHIVSIETDADAPSTFDESARLSVSGSKIYDGNGNQVLLRGFGSAGGEFIYRKWNLWDWDTWYNNESISAIQDLGANVFRLMVEINYYHDQGDSYVEDYCEYADRFIDKGMYLIISWMGNSDFDSKTDDAIAFFKYVTERYGDNPYVLYEIANEPFDRKWDDLKAYADTVIPTIRENAPNSLIIMPTGFGYRGEKTNEAIINNPLDFDNIIYQEHMYVGANLTSGFLDKTTALVDAGYPVIFTEWGATDANGRDNYYNDYSIAFLKYCELHDINWCNFQYSDFRPNSGIYQSSTHKPYSWTNDFADDSLSDSGKMIKSYFANGYVEPIASTMMNYTEGYAFWDDSIRTTITNVYFVSDNDFNGSYDMSWDVSMSLGSEDVMAYLDGTDLYIVAKNGPVLSPRSNDYVFKNFTNLKELSLDNYDTRYVTYTNALFAGCTSLEEIDLSNYDTSQLTTFCSEFLNCRSIKEIDLRDSDLSNINSFENAFYNCHSLEKLYLPDLDSSAVNNTTRAYKNIGKNTPSTEIIYADTSDEDIFANATN